MKRLFALIAAVVLVAVPALFCFPVSAGSNIYDTARDGDLLYTVNFNGDENFKPEYTKGSMKMTVDPVDPTVATFENLENAKQAWWGGTIDFLPLNSETLYTVYWTVTREKNVAIGYYPDEYFGVYGYQDKIKLMETSRSLLGHDYSTFANRGINVNATVQSYALEVNGVNGTLALYVWDETLSNYVLFDETEQEFEIFEFMTDHLGIYFYVYYANHVSTISDCHVNKGLAFGTVKPKLTEPETTEEIPVTEVTTAEQTTAEITTAEITTAAPVVTTVTPVETQPEKQGCGSFAAALVLPAVCAACVVLKRRKN